ncbi:MAG: PilZ domain-containing protein [Planctomycetia bacterium]|nr:PilZ domain-containing protein [Planctomycetia bacterium]
MNEWRLLETMRGRRLDAGVPRKDCEAVLEVSRPFRQALSLLGLVEPRCCPRYVCRQRVYYRSVTLYDSVAGTGVLVNVSRSGVRLLARDGFAPGQFLTLEFPELAASFPKLLRMKVVYTALASRSSVFVGGSWLPELTPAQLDSLLQAAVLV